MTEWVVAGRFASPLGEGWRDELAAMLGRRPRRIGSWAEMVLYGALRCMADAGETVLPDDAVLMLGSASGTQAATAVALAQLACGMLMPATFLQTQPGQAIAALSSQLGWRGHACFVAGADASALQALGETQAGAGGILLGVVDDAGAGVSSWRRLRPGSCPDTHTCIIESDKIDR